MCNDPDMAGARSTRNEATGGDLGTLIRKLRKSRNLPNNEHKVFRGNVNFIEKLIKNMKSKNMETRWLELDDTKNTPIIVQKVFRDNDDTIIDMGGIIALAKNFGGSGRVHINVGDGNEFFNTDRDVLVLQSIVLHELRHVWQMENPRDWKPQRGELKKDGKTNIFAEVDAYNIQFKFEKQFVVGKVDVLEEIREIFERVDSNQRDSEERKNDIKANILFYGRPAAGISPIDIDGNRYFYIQLQQVERTQ